MAGTEFRALRRAIQDMSYDCRYLAQIALYTNLYTDLRATSGGCTGANLDILLQAQGLYTKQGITNLLDSLAKTTLLNTSPVLRAAINLFVAYGYSKTCLPDRLKVPCMHLSVFLNA